MSNFLSLLFSVLYISIFAEIIMSYIPNLRQSQVYKIITSFNYPILEPFRRVQEKIFGQMMLDFSPVLAIMFLSLIKGLLLG
ncbi:MAG: YggT family protein [Clostridium celatum]|nr:YggT family protein [Clostridium celatum]